MPQTTYLSPGVYIEEIPSAIQPIAGVGTSTAGFIGVTPDEITIPIAAGIKKTNIEIGQGDGNTTTFDLPDQLVSKAKGTFQFKVNNVVKPAELQNKPDSDGVVQVKFAEAPAANAKITGNYVLLVFQVKNELIGQGKNKTDGSPEDTFSLQQYPNNKSDTKTFKFRVNGSPQEATFVDDSRDNNGNPIAQVKFTSAPPVGSIITGDYQANFPTFKVVPVGEVKLCTNFSEFKKFFGDFSTDPGQNTLAQAVYGFFNNGGTRCYVMRVDQPSKITADFLKQKFEPIDEIAIVAAPGIIDNAVISSITIHCQQETQDRFAIFDSPEEVEDLSSLDPQGGDNNILPDFSNYAGYYFPWIQILDPAAKTLNPEGDGRIYVPPSGHIAGIYARVDNTRGVFKAPANEVVLGALGLKQKISKAQQAGLNPQGVNCIRDLNGNIRVWGARTLGGDANGEYKYINVRRTMLFLRESIDQGTQWAVFEPNDTKLWAKIILNVTAFLTIVWRNGALFGNTPQEAFYVKCDEETNPPEIRELGQVITEIGVAIVRPAEFVIFRISQWTGPSNQ
ncbi:MAG: phage tail sheath subtilisin-like domain-containing protein [Pelatocladus maniniholoensis HA4357-MV3]|uniref:Phage tail sheath subtilisin-like domain-containing protein n=1 Tax=Pelatocladus maniniholoensis HA4357-MV3 TaxID=1117104 RepID=A0A9E3HC69_9NOST|nr:phage tail sheath subtilisin-like domain-containing protein [Pelatocladus maniniholoensis HA4357-MV3]